MRSECLHTHSADLSAGSISEFKTRKMTAKRLLFFFLLFFFFFFSEWVQGHHMLRTPDASKPPEKEKTRNKGGRCASCSFSSQGDLASNQSSPAVWLWRGTCCLWVSSVSSSTASLHLLLRCTKCQRGGGGGGTRGGRWGWWWGGGCWRMETSRVWSFLNAAKIQRALWIVTSTPSLKEAGFTGNTGIRKVNPPPSPVMHFFLLILQQKNTL